MSSTQHVLDLIDNALSWDGISDAMTVEYGRRRRAGAPGILAEAPGRLPDDWQPVGYLTDTAPFAREGDAPVLSWSQRSFIEQARLSMLLYGNVHVGRLPGPAVRVVPPPDFARLQQAAAAAAARLVRFVETNLIASPPRATDRPDLMAREKALAARRNRDTGPARNPHRHRGL